MYNEDNYRYSPALQNDNRNSKMFRTKTVNDSADSLQDFQN